MIKEFIVPVPPLDEQTGFINYVKKISNNDYLIKKTNDNLTSLNYSLMAKAFTGELVT